MLYNNAESESVDAVVTVFSIRRIRKYLAGHGDFHAYGPEEARELCQRAGLVIASYDSTFAPCDGRSFHYGVYRF